MHLARPSLLLALGFCIDNVVASPHGQGHGPRRRYNDDGTTATDDLNQITNAPGPPTIQPGIPALQPSIPTTGVASLDIPPAQQTSSWRSLTPVPAPKGSQPSDPALTSPLASASTPLNLGPVSASVSRSASTISSIPYLSDLMSQLFSRSSTTPASSIYAPTVASNPAAWEPKPAVTSRLDTTSPVEGNPGSSSPPASTPSMLIYSITLPSYSNGLDTSGIVESLTRSSPAEDKDKPSATVYSYNLPPYTPKVPTYVATSAGTAPLDMTSGAPGGPGGAAPTNRNFLPKGFVDPLKDPVTVTSSMVPVYSPACLGNAYGGGYVIKPILSVANANATGIAKVPPAYGFSYKFEPTITPGYGGAVIIVDTKAPAPTLSSQPSAGLPSKDVIYSSSRASQTDGANSGTHLPLKDAPPNVSKDFEPTMTGSMYSTSTPTNLSPHGVPGSIQASGPTGSQSSANDEPSTLFGPPLSSKDASPVNTKDHVSIPTGSISGTITQGNSIPSLMFESVQPHRSSAGVHSFDKDRPTVNPAVPASTPGKDILGMAPSGNGVSTPSPTSAQSSGAYNGPLVASKDIWVTNPRGYISTTASDSQNTNTAGTSIFSSGQGSAQLSEPASGGLLPSKDASVISPEGLWPTSNGGSPGTHVMISSFFTPQTGDGGHSSSLATRVNTVIVTTSTTWCPSTALNHLSIISSILGDVPLSTAVPGSGNLANGGVNDKDAYPMDAGVTSSTVLGAVTISRSTPTDIGSAVATLLPQGVFQKAAVAFDSTVADAYGTASGQHLSSKINSTFLLSGDESGVPAFQGKSARLPAGVVMVVAVTLFAGLLSSYA
ncbi:MAG: hypothetical protein Q9226_000484 [Calogaya cf. arnoldii]